MIIFAKNIDDLKLLTKTALDRYYPAAFDFIVFLGCDCSKVIENNDMNLTCKYQLQVKYDNVISEIIKHFKNNNTDTYLGLSIRIEGEREKKMDIRELGISFDEFEKMKKDITFTYEEMIQAAINGLDAINDITFKKIKKNLKKKTTFDIDEWIKQHPEKQKIEILPNIGDERITITEAAEIFKELIDMMKKEG